jgi:TetR/AcrR family transcriptional regulator, regulator of cefoperazone and chloramphenicol sensitivity
MPNIKNNVAGEETRRRLIDAAGMVFAERGLHAATIKEITDRAGVNMASVNYHFRDKFELYAVVIRHILGQGLCFPLDVDPATSPEDQMRNFIAHAIRELFDPTRPQWQVTVLAHEFAQPTAAVDAILDELIKPRAARIRSLVQAILGSETPENYVARGMFSVISQCFHYLYTNEMVRRVMPELVRENTSEDLAAHIAEFSLAGLHAMRAQIKRDHTPQPVTLRMPI